MGYRDNNPNKSWAEVTFKQACFDFKNGQWLLNSRNVNALALVAAQFQQCAEKSMKAMVILENKKKLDRDDDVIKTHTVWKDKIGHDSGLRGIRKRLLDAIHPYKEKDIIELEAMAPHGSTDELNTEYPWEQNGVIWAPAAFFVDKEKRVQDFLSIAKTIWENASNFSPKLEKVRVAVDEQYAILSQIG